MSTSSSRRSPPAEMSSIRLSYHTGAASPMARLDPRVKLLYIVWVLAMIVVFSHPAFQSFIVLTVIAGIVLGRLRPGSVARAGRIGLFVGLVSWLLWIVFLGDQGTPMLVLGPVTVTDAGVLAGLSAALRITTVLFAFLIVAMTTPNRDIIVALQRLHVPVVFSIVVGLVLRLIAQLQAEHATIVQAQLSRGTEFDRGNPVGRFRKHTAYVIPLSLRALKIVSELSVALEARAFDPYGRRTFVRQLAYRRIDRILLIAMAITLIASITLRVGGYGGLDVGSFGGLGQ